MVKRTFLYIIISMWYLLLANTTFAYTHEDTLRGSNGRGRSWWDVLYYDLHVSFDTARKSISGKNTIRFKVANAPVDSMQIDLQELMFLDSITLGGRKLNVIKEGRNVWWVLHSFSDMRIGSTQEITVHYHGKPKVAANPPWDGGFIWTKDHNGNPWIAVACQGLGASAWWPCKDLQSDEPDQGMIMHYTVPKGMTCIANGKQAYITAPDGAMQTWHWQVQYPINTYNATFYIGDYVGWKDTLKGEGGNLEISYYVIKGNEEKAHKQFADVRSMLQGYEYWMGKYPFYNDGYKLVEAPYLGMEHQSAVAYGNNYKMGYKGMDRSGTGVGDLFDYIIVHESGHEWFGNNMTAKDIADNWIHEGFTTYAEALYVQWAFGKEKAFKFTRGEWHNIRNDRPVIGDYGVNDDGSSDKYDKGAAVVHMIRMMMDNEANFRDLLRGLNRSFYHATTSSAELEQMIAGSLKMDLKPFFNQYLRTTMIPQFEWYIKNKKLFYRFTSVVPGFWLPLEVSKGKHKAKITVTENWQNINWKKGGHNINVSEDFLIRTKD